MKNFLSLIFISLFLCSCVTSFTAEEKKIIYNQQNQSARVLKITDYQDSLVLRKKSVDVKKIKNNKELLALVEKLKLTMKEEEGVGIAAPQIGINKNIFLFLRLDKPGYPVQAVINPKIISYPKETICFQGDGCLSIPNLYGDSIRFPWIEVEYQNEKGEVIREKLQGGSRMEDFTGIIFQHEFDHTLGILFIDKLCP